MSFTLPLSVVAAYIVVSAVKPRYTRLGVFVSRKFKNHNNKPLIPSSKGAGKQLIFLEIT
jgi:hypothetical protein